MYKVDNAVIMAAGTSSRFAPLSYEKHKALVKVKGEVLIERQIRQLLEVGIPEIIIVTGYKKEQFEYLKDKYGVILVENTEYEVRNNHSSIYAVKKYLKNSYICSSDNYFMSNPFESEVEDSYYAAVYSKGVTKEWCMTENKNGYITDVQIGGSNAWYMLGHAFWNEVYSLKFLDILEKEYNNPDIKSLYWENIFIDHMDELKMKIRKYSSDIIFEFDTLDELRIFDKSYIDNTRSFILKEIADKLKCSERDIKEIEPYKGLSNVAEGFCFKVVNQVYEYSYADKVCQRR